MNVARTSKALTPAAALVICIASAAPGVVVAQSGYEYQVHNGATESMYLGCGNARDSGTLQPIGANQISRINCPGAVRVSQDGVADNVKNEAGTFNCEQPELIQKFRLLWDGDDGLHLADEGCEVHPL